MESAVDSDYFSTVHPPPVEELLIEQLEKSQTFARAPQQQSSLAEAFQGATETATAVSSPTAAENEATQSDNVVEALNNQVCNFNSQLFATTLVRIANTSGAD